MVHVASSRRSRVVQAEDEQVDLMYCVGPCYPYFVIFIVLGSRCILVFLFFLGHINRTLKGCGTLSILLFLFCIS
jgi:hypothetical protein